jgi:hypothetical protein
VVLQTELPFYKIQNISHLIGELSEVEKRSGRRVLFCNSDEALVSARIFVSASTVTYKKI